MTDARGGELLAAIRATPDDRALRLVYADWLMERGDPRGEWIALSCGQATEDTDQEMRRRALWQHHGEQWESEDRADSGLHKISYRDGLPDYAQLGEGADLQRKLHPIRTLAVHVFPGLLGALADSPLLETVRYLRFHGSTDRIGEDELVAFLNAPALARLEGLGVWSGDQGRVLWPALARFHRLGELKQLELDATIGVRRARWLGRSCPSLEVFGCTRLSDFALRTLAEVATFRLRALRLDVDGATGNDAAISELLASPLARELAELHLRGVELGTQPLRYGADALPRLPCAASLRELRIKNYGVSIFSAIIHDLSAGRFPALETLGIDDPAAHDELAGTPMRHPTLTALELDSVRLTRAEIERIMSSLPRLERLALDGAPLDDEHMHAIARSEQARSLRHLSLEYAHASGATLETIVRSGQLNELRSLSLSGNQPGNQFDDAALRALADAPFDRMARLRVADSRQPRVAPLFARAWKPTDELDTYERRLELSGRAVAR